MTEIEHIIWQFRTGEPDSQEQAFEALALIVGDLISEDVEDSILLPAIAKRLAESPRGRQVIMFANEIISGDIS